jgi:hypothetical protein
MTRDSNELSVLHPNHCRVVLYRSGRFRNHHNFESRETIATVNVTIGPAAQVITSTQIAIQSQTVRQCKAEEDEEEEEEDIYCGS